MPSSFLRMCIGLRLPACSTASGVGGGTTEEEPPVGRPSRQDERQTDHDPTKKAARTCRGSGSRLGAWRDGPHCDQLPVRTMIVGVTVTVTVAMGTIALAVGAALAMETPSIRTTPTTAMSADHMCRCVLVTEIPSCGVVTEFVVASLAFRPRGSGG